MNKQGTIQEMRIHSKELGEDLEILIYVPANFSPLCTYTFIIAQDGRDYFQMGRIPRIADELLAEELIENIIIVGVPYQNVVDRRRKYHPEGEQQTAYIRFLAHELVPFLDDTFPGHHVSYGRALAGDSLAATVSLMAAIEYPSTFGKVLMHSPFVNDQVLETVQVAKNFKQLSLYHVVGTEETAVKMTDGQTANFLESNRKLHFLLKEKGFNCFYDEFAGNHTWKYWQPDLKRALLTMFE